MRRREDWEAALARYLEAHQAAVFAWGQLDCVLFAAGAVAAMTGEDPAAGLRGSWRSQAGAARALKREGCVDVAELAGRYFDEIHPALARRGDIVMAEGSLGLCCGRNSVFIGQEGEREGLVTLASLQCDRAWRVPFAEAVHG